MTLPIEDVTRRKILPDDLDMIVLKTLGDEEESIFQTAKLWPLALAFGLHRAARILSAHEVRMATSYCLLMISDVNTSMYIRAACT